MKILTYKRTHTGDPDINGQFGIEDCMGRVRDWSYDAVIGVGGTGPEPQSYGIAGRITWAGLNPIRIPRLDGRGHVVTFEHFKLLDQSGPLLFDLAPLLAKRMYEGGARTLLSSYSRKEKEEADSVLSTILTNNSFMSLSRKEVRKNRIERRKVCRKICNLKNTRT